MSEWAEPRTLRQCVSVAIVLPSGVRTGQFKVKVCESGDHLELKVDWPKPISDIAMLHRKWSLAGTLSDVHPKVLGFENALKLLRQNCNEKISSVARIGLPFTVEPHIFSKSNLMWHDDTTHVIYMDLKSVCDDYAMANDSESFEIC